LLAAVIGAVTIRTPATNAAFKDATSTLAFVSGAAVAIERVIEAFWTFLGSALGAYWPLTAVTRQVNALVAELDTSMKPFHEDLKGKLEKLASEGRLTQEEMERGKVEIDRIKRRFDELKAMAPDNQRVQLLTAAASQHVSYFYARYKGIVAEIDRAGAVANTAISGLQDFLVSFKDNPGRRLISIYLGAILGVGVAGVMGLDVFQALLVQDPARIDHPTAQIILTGMMIGLGSSPTHEVIRVVQEYKNGRKGENIAKPDLPG
jgi:hypothetical protein